MTESCWGQKVVSLEIQRAPLFCFAKAVLQLCFIGIFVETGRVLKEFKKEKDIQQISVVLLYL